MHDDSVFTRFNCCLCCWWVAMPWIGTTLQAPRGPHRRSPGVNTKLRRPSLSCRRSPWRCTCRRLKCHSSAQMMFLLTEKWTRKLATLTTLPQSNILLGICWLRTVFAKRSANCLYPSTRTTCRTLRSAAKERNSRASVADICRAWWHAALRRVNSPFQLPTNHLKSFKTSSTVQETFAC